MHGRSVLLAGVLASACTSTTTVSRPLSESDATKLNAVLRGNFAHVVLAPPPDRPRLEMSRRTVEVMSFGIESAEWVEQPEGQRSVPYAAIQRIEIVSHGKGALEGMGVGALLGGVLGLAVGGGQTKNPLIVFPLAGGALLGSGIGALIGAGAGHTSRFVFADAAPGPPER